MKPFFAVYTTNIVAAGSKHNIFVIVAA